ncbi:LuxR C-terminal-related transcriptional regulator [Silvimonas amylolytica]|uniref:DNA-binding response regulator n=1 Tax=Silvimonas amylolytica TaxID=449663 RepID=A0ABQ2PGL6_9NEIS|nr:response regulator transcription factor [Silvimonas amylolytica]GGP24399.1 DNA-binding response regulator [Silvimonas amylolytica]
MTSDTRCQLAVVHRNPLIACGIQGLLANASDIAVAVYGPEAIESARFTDVDVIVGDYDTASVFLRRLRGGSRYPVSAPRVLLLTARDREWEVRNALDLGAHGYLLLDCDARSLQDCVRKLARGQRYISDALSQRLADSLSRESLTAREQDVLTLLASGNCNKEIASSLGISVGTTKTHVAAILDKLQADSRTQAAAIARDRGLLASSYAGF